MGLCQRKFMRTYARVAPDCVPSGTRFAQRMNHRPVPSPGYLRERTGRYLTSTGNAFAKCAARSATETAAPCSMVLTGTIQRVVSLSTHGPRRWHQAGRRRLSDMVRRERGGRARHATYRFAWQRSSQRSASGWRSFSWSSGYYAACMSDDSDPGDSGDINVQITANSGGNEDDPITVLATFTPVPPNFTPEALQTRSALQNRRRTDGDRPGADSPRPRRRHRPSIRTSRHRPACRRQPDHPAGSGSGDERRDRARFYRFLQLVRPALQQGR